MAGIEVCLQVAIVNREAVRDFESALSDLKKMSMRAPWDRELLSTIRKFERAAASIVIETPAAIERRIDREIKAGSKSESGNTRKMREH